MSHLMTEIKANDGPAPSVEDTPAAAEDQGEEIEEEIIDDHETNDDESYEEEEVVESDDESFEEEVVESDEEEQESTGTDTGSGTDTGTGTGTGSQSENGSGIVKNKGQGQEVKSQVQPDPEGFADFAKFPPPENAFHGSSSSSQTTSDKQHDLEKYTSTILVESSNVGDTDHQSEHGRSIQFAPSISAGTESEIDLERQRIQQEQLLLTSGNKIQNRIEMKYANEKTRVCWYWLVCLLIFAMLGAGAFVGWFLVNENRDSSPSLDDGNFTLSPTAAPTVGLTTAFDPIQDNCQFAGVANPHPIDQCLCFNEVTILADDVRERYESRKENFIPTIYQGFNDDISSCTPRNQALLWISSGNDFSFSYEERVERFGLATMYAALAGNNWELKEGWYGEGSICQWQGVLCNDDGLVQTLSLSDNNLAGTIPPEVALLEDLRLFFAARNQLEGSIPEGLIGLDGLETLDLSFNSLSGPLSPAVGNAKELIELNLEQNMLSGRITQAVADAEKLEILNIGSNELVGSFPSTIFELSALKRLDIGGNELSGTIPAAFSQLDTLTSLTLGPNNFVGEIPSSLSELSALESLTIRDIPQLQGRIPAILPRSLRSLRDLTVTQTGVSGNIETDFGLLPLLTRLDLSRNQLRGTIPSELGNLVNLRLLDLGSNFIGGSIPPALGNLGNLTSLRLNDNVLRNSVPSTFGLLGDLQFLRLDGNVLTGRVSAEVCSLRSENLTSLIVDCTSTENGVEIGLFCEIPSCCTGCRT